MTFFYHFKPFTFFFRIPFTSVKVASATYIRAKLKSGAEFSWENTRPVSYGYHFGVLDSRLFGICIWRERYNYMEP